MTTRRDFIKQAVAAGVVIFFFMSATCMQPLRKIRYTTKHFQLSLTDNGQVEGFTDLRSGINYADTVNTEFCVLKIHKDDTGITADNVVKKGNTLTFSFPGTPVAVKLQVRAEKSYLVFDVVDISGGDFYSLQFARVPLRIDYNKNDFAACAMTRKINTRTLDYPGKSNLLGGQCFSALGYEGAGVFVLGMPEMQLRETMKQVVDSYQPGEMPVSHAGGPYAMDDTRNYGTYILTAVPITAEQVDKWVALLSRFGVNQIYFHQGTPFRHADFVFNESAYPNGVADVRKMCEAFNRHGFKTGLLTYDKFIPGDSRYVTPVPSKDLDVMRIFTLADALGTDEETIPVVESTGDVSETTGYFVRNSKVVRIDDELIIFGNPSRSSPYGFTSCQRGAYGTGISAHKKGAPVEHLTQYFGYFAPKIDSELFYEIARETARAYNEGGFDLLYLDGSESTFVIVEDKELTWYYEALFVNEILKHTKTPPSLEYSGFSDHLWYGISRFGTWDCSVRGHKHFFDLHIESNLTTADRFYLPGQVGWTKLCPSGGDNTDHFQKHIFFQEDMEYLGAKMVANNYGGSYLDFIGGMTAPPFTFRNGAILNQYDSLRRNEYFTAETRQRLRDPNARFLLQHSGNDWYLTEANYEQVVLGGDNREFTYRNPYQEQTPMIRIEHRHQPVAYHSPEGVDLLSFDEKQPVKFETTGRGEAGYGNYTHAYARPEVKREFEPAVDLSKHLGLGLWVYGDGGGQRINIRMESPFHLVSGFIDRILTVDFTGWRYFALVEADNGKDEDTPFCPMHSCDWIYDEFRETVHFDNISKISLQVKGNTENLRFRTIRALPLVESYLVDPELQANGTKITFLGKIKNGHYMEYMPESGRAVVYDAMGNEVSEMQPVTTSFQLPQGDTSLRFSGANESKQPVSVRITLRTNDNKHFF